MGGGPGACSRLTGHYQERVEQLLGEQMTWRDIFDTIEREQRAKKGTSFTLHQCCRQTLQAGTPVYDRFEGMPNTENYTLLGMNTNRETGYTVHGRWYKLDANKGVVFTGYGRDNTPNITEADELLKSVVDDDDDIIIDSGQLDDDDILTSVHTRALSSINQMMFG